MGDAIVRLSRNFSPGVSAEIKVQNALTKEAAEFQHATSAEQYWKAGISTAPYQYEMLLSSLPKGSRILDVGVGFGQSSVFLAALGYDVYAVEPTLLMCQVIQEAAQRFKLLLTVVQAVGEDLSEIGSDFDVVVFNSSLHHCDDPIRAISESFKCLKPGGQILLVGENMLKPWMSQERYLRLLEKDPLGMGHYGGNEHAYHNSTYIRMLKTSFPVVELQIPRMDSALEEIEMVLGRRMGGQRIYRSNMSVMLRFMFYIWKEKVRKRPWLYKMFAKCSLVNVHFRACKNV
jgi:SAM-dependent methyltransferase